IFKIVLQNAVQRTLVPDDDVIQTLEANGSDQPLHEWILPERSRCRDWGFCAHALDRCANFSPDNRISIADQIARRFTSGPRHVNRRDRVWSRNPIRMKAKDESSRGPDGPDQGVTPRYITKKSPRNVGMAPFKTSLTNISCFQWDLFWTIRL